MIQMMALNRYTPVPAISPSAAETDSNDDEELRGQKEMWRQRMKILKDEENRDDSV